MKKLYRMEIFFYKQNPTNLGSGCCEICKLDNKWWERPKWLHDQTNGLNNQKLKIARNLK